MKFLWWRGDRRFHRILNRRPTQLIRLPGALICSISRRRPAVESQPLGKRSCLPSACEIRPLRFQGEQQQWARLVIVSKNKFNRRHIHSLHASRVNQRSSGMEGVAPEH
jgi:hypothetical protein